MNTNYIRRLTTDLAITMRDYASEYFESWTYQVYKEVERTVTRQTGDYSNVGTRWEFINCTGTSAQVITLLAPKLDGDVVVIKRSGTGAVTYSSMAGIDGVTTALSLAAQYDSVMLVGENGAWHIMAQFT